MNPDNNGEFPNREQQPKSNIQARFTSFRQKLAGFKDAYVSNALERVPVEDISSDTVARTILEKLGNPMQERMGRGRHANPFDITSVITGLGYIGISHNTDYLKKFPEVYNATRQALFRLEQEGVLESHDFEEINSHGERKYYRVADENLLSETVKKALDEAKASKSR